MNDESRSEDATPWWSGRVGETTGDSADSADTAETVDSAGTAETVDGGDPVVSRLPQDPWRAPAAGSTDTAPTVRQPSYGAYDVWAPTEPGHDSLGRDPGRPVGSRPGVLVALAAAIALVAGAAGGAIGYVLADQGGGGTVTVDGSGLTPAPARDVGRPAGSIPGIAAKVLPSVVQIKVQTSQGQATGSGFVVDKSGIVVTNNHVVADAQGDVELSFGDGTTTTAKVLGTSASYDLAALRISARNLPALPLGNSDSVVVGDQVLAIGSPLGLSGTVTSGIVSAKNRPVTAGGENGSDSAYINAIQTDAAINPGNSGGPLVNLDGEVIGVNSAIATVGGGTFGQEAGNIGVGFAIPINQVRRTVDQLLATGKAEFPVIGASLDGRYDGEGARIASDELGGKPPLVPGGPAERAGLQPGDVIVAIDGTPVADSSELIVAIRSHRPGQTVRLTVRRGGGEREFRVTLSASQG